MCSGCYLIDNDLKLCKEHVSIMYQNFINSSWHDKVLNWKQIVIVFSKHNVCYEIICNKYIPHRHKYMFYYSILLPYTYKSIPIEVNIYLAGVNHALLQGLLLCKNIYDKRIPYSGQIRSP